MSKDIFGDKNPIKKRSAFFSMVTLGLVIALFGFFNQKIAILFNQEAITPFVYFGLAIPVVLLSWTEVGLKKWSDWSKLSSFTNQQLLTFSVSIAVILSTGLAAFVPGVAIFLGWFNGGVFAIAGLTIMLEAVR